MKLRTTVGALLEAFSLTSPTLDKKGPSAYLYLNANDKLGFLYLFSTNLVSETATKISVKEIEVGGEILVNPGKLQDGLSGLPKDTPVSLTLNATGNNLKVQAGDVKFSLAANTGVKEMGDRMRAIPNSKVVPAAIVPATELIQFTKRSQFCIPNDQTGQKASLAALKLATGDDREEAFATDGSIAVHIASAKKQGKGEGLGTAGLLIPAQALQALSALVTKKRGENVSIVLIGEKNKVYFRFADGTHFGALTSRMAYPNLRPIIDQKVSHYFDVPREGLKLALLRCNSFLPSIATKKILELEFGPERIFFKANGDDSLSDSVAITYKGEAPATPVKLGMNIDHLVNIATGSTSQDLTFGFASDEKPLIVIDKEGDEDERIHIKYVVMGVRLGAAAK